MWTPDLKVSFPRAENDIEGHLREGLASAQDAYLRVASAFKACMTKFSADFPTNFVRDEQDKILRGCLG